MASATGKIVAVVGVSIAVVALACFLTWKQTNASWRAKWLERDTADLKELADNAQKNAATEHDWQRKFAALDADYQEKLKAVNDEADRTVDDYKRGNLRLRASLNCTARNMPAVATSSGVSDAAAKCGLSTRDVEFLIRYAGKANATAKQLAAAQALLKVIYAARPDLRQ